MLFGARPGPPRVLVGRVEQALVVGVGVNGRHVARFDPEVVLDHLHHRDDAVGRARGVGDDVVLLGVIILVVDLEHERGIHALTRGRDDDLLRPAFEVGCGPVAAGKDARRLHDDIGANVAPGDLRRVPLGEGLDLVVADAQHVAIVRNVLGPDPVRRVVLEQIRQAVERHQVVRRHHLDVATVHRGLGEQHPDPTETVDSYSYRHLSLLTSTPATRLLCPLLPGS